MNVIFTGKMASGKTALANYLVARYNFTRIALADPIKEIEKELDLKPAIEITNKYFGEILDPMEKAVFCKILEEAKLIPREEPKPRKRLQFIGTEGARKRISDEIWIWLAHHKASQFENVCIDDVRFPNEFHFFHSKGWTPILLITHPEIQLKRMTELYGPVDPTILTHDSELGVDSIMLEIPASNQINTSYTTVEQAAVQMERILFP